MVWEGRHREVPPYPDLQGLPPSHTRPPRSTADHRDAASSAIFARIYAAGNNLRTTLPDLRAFAKRPLASPHRAANWRRSVDDQPRACSQHRRARLSLQASAREGLAETRRGLGQAAQNDARFGGADRRKTDARAVEPIRSAGVWRRMASPLSVTSASISMSGKTRKTGARCIFTCVTAAKNTTGARAGIRGAG